MEKILLRIKTVGKFIRRLILWLPKKLILYINRPIAARWTYAQSSILNPQSLTELKKPNDRVPAQINIDSKKPLLIGLTGGICSGKSLVADLFAALNVDVIDADVIARELVDPSSVYFQKIIEHFGSSILNDDGTINRHALRDLIFSNVRAKLWLEKLLHPVICETMMQRVEQSSSPYCILVIPLLAETQLPFQLDRILVVDTSEDLQRERLSKRDQLSDQQIYAMLKQQATRTQRIQIAHDVIHNDKDILNLKEQVQMLHEFYLAKTDV